LLWNVTLPFVRISDPYPCSPLWCVLALRLSLMMHHCTVTPVIPAPDTDSTSSLAQLSEQ